ncbi:MAG: DMT family transporter [Alphaproteobacteria bacterium]|nr:DMT family transporter [Alphaproteobacteria bacterium]
MSDASAAAVIDRAEYDRSARAAIIRLIIAILAISFTPLLFRLSELGPTATAFSRTVLAIPILALWVALERRRSAPLGGPKAVSWRRDGLGLVAGGAIFAANIVCYAWAVHFTAIANASLLSNLSPIFVALGSFVLFGERMRRSFIAAMAAAIIGTIILTSEKLAIDAGQATGDGMALLSSLFFATYLMMLGRMSLRLSSAVIMLWTAIFSAAGLLAASLLSRENLVPTTLYGWSMLFALAIVSYALGQGLLTTALARLGASFSAVSLLLLPVGAALQGWVVLGEPLSLRQTIGGAIILASILGARLASR